MTLTKEQADRFTDHTARAIASVMASAEVRALEAKVYSFASSDADNARLSDESASATMAVDSLRGAFAAYVAWGENPLWALSSDVIRADEDATLCAAIARARDELAAELGVDVGEAAA